ncbi:hypothetical protein HZC07_01310 [Candidatus Micrarchaeota archaeon]|nr:hypothetical protein [Candidatus Micrarchaeota archaeon]
MKFYKYIQVINISAQKLNGLDKDKKNKQYGEYMEQEGFFGKWFPKIFIILISNLDLIISIGIILILITYFDRNLTAIDTSTIAQISGGLLLVTVGVAAFFGHDKKIIEKLSTRKTWMYAAYIPSISAGLTIVSTFMGNQTVTVFLFIYAISSTLSISYSVIGQVFKLE